MKCPDKSASISFTLYLEVEKEQIRQKDNELDTKSHSINRNKCESPRSVQQRNNLSNYSTICRQLNDSKLSVPDTKPFTYRNISQRPTANSNNYLIKIEDQPSSQRDKISKLQRQKSQMMREIRSIKYGNLRPEAMKPRLDDSFEKIKTLQREIQSQKDKMSEVEHQLTKKNYKENQLQRDNQALQRRYDKFLLQYTAQKSKRQIFQKSSRQLEFQLKTIKQKVQDLQLTIENLNKKMEFKQNVLKEQLKSMTEKFSSSQRQKQKMLIEKNDMIVEFEEKQRGWRLSLREKEKLWNQEKTKLFKQIEGMNNSTQLLKINKEDYEQSIKEMQEQIKLLNKEKNQLENELNHEKQLFISEIFKHQKKLENKMETESLEEEIRKLQNELKKSKKLLGERQQQILKLQQLTSTTKSLHQKITKKQQQTQHQLKQKTAQNKILQRQYDLLTKQNQKIKKQSLQFSQKLHDVTFANQNKTSEFAALNDELHEKDRKYQEQINRISQELAIKKKELKEIVGEFNVVKEHQSRLIGQLLQLQKEMEEITVQVNHKYIQNENLKAELQQSRQSEQSFKTQISHLTIKHTQLQQLLSTTQLTNHSQSFKSQSRIIELQKRLKSLSQSSSSQTAIWSSKISKLEQLFTQKDIQLKQLRNDRTDLETEIIQKDGEIGELQHKLRLKNNEMQFLKDQLSQTRTQLQEKDSQSKNLSVSLQQTEQQLFISNQKLQQLTAQLTSLSQKSISTSHQLQQYKSCTIKCLKQFFTLLNSHQQFLQGKTLTKSELELLKHQKSQEITKSIIQSLNYKNSYIITVNRKFIENEEIIGQLKNSLQETNKTKVDQELQILKLQQGNQQLQKSLSQEAKGLIKAQQDWNHQKQNLQTQISQLFHQKESLQKQLLQITNKLQTQKLLNQKTESQISQLKIQLKQSTTKSLQESKSNQSSITSLNNQLQAKEKDLSSKDKEIQRQNGVIEIQKEQIKELQAKNVQNNGSLKQEKLKLKNLTKDLQDKKAQSARLLKQVQRLRQQIQQTKKSSSSKLQQTQQQLKSQLKQQLQQISTLKQSNQSLSKSNQTFPTRQKQLQQQCTQLKNQLQVQTSKTAEQLKLITTQKTEIIQLKETNYSLETNKNKLIKDNQTISKVKKMSEDETQRLKQIIQNQRNTLEKLTDRIRQDDKVKKELENQLNLQKKQTKAQTKDSQSKASNIKSLQLIKENEYKKLSTQLQQTKQQNKKLILENHQHQNKSKQLQAKLTNLIKQLQNSDKKKPIETNTLLPIKPLLTEIKSTLNLRMKSFEKCDQAKNKLLKNAGKKHEGQTEQSYSDFVRELSTAINALKINVLTKLSDVKTKQKVMTDFSTLNSLFAKFNQGGYA